MLSRVTTSLGEDTLVGYREGHMVLGRQITAGECCCLPMFWVGLSWKPERPNPRVCIRHAIRWQCFIMFHHKPRYVGARQRETSALVRLEEAASRRYGKYIQIALLLGLVSESSRGGEVL